MRIGLINVRRRKIQMKLNEFITQTIYEIVKGMDDVDKKLREEKIGKVWKNDFDTLGQHLVIQGIVKGKPEPQKDAKGDKRPCPPVMLINFDVGLEVKEEKEQGSKAELDVGAKVLSVLKVSGDVEGHSHKGESEKSAHNIKFTVPIGINPDM
jgi:hypothetical protein